MHEGQIREVLASDRADVEEMARHTYNGHDWIMPELATWLSSDDHLTLGVDVGGRLKAIEDVAIVDGGRTAWLQALRVHPDQRRKGQASRLQRHAIDAAVARFPGLRQLRYTTGSWNTASLRIAAACGLADVWRWGVYLVADADAPSEKRADDAVVFEPVLFERYLESVLSEFHRVAPAALGKGNDLDRALALANDAKRACPSSAGWGGAVKASAADVNDLVSLAGAVGPLPPVWVVDWKGVERTKASLESVLQRPGWAARCFRCGDDRGGAYSFGVTREDNSGLVRVVTLGARHADGCDDLGWASLLLLLAAEVRQALTDGADNLMFFFDSAFQDKVLNTGLGRDWACVLVEKSVGGESADDGAASR